MVTPTPHRVDFSLSGEKEALRLTTDFGLAVLLDQGASLPYGTLLSPCCGATIELVEVAGLECQACEQALPKLSDEFLESYPLGAIGLPDDFDAWLEAAVTLYLGPLEAQLVSADIYDRLEALQPEVDHYLHDNKEDLESLSEEGQRGMLALLAAHSGAVGGEL